MTIEPGTQCWVINDKMRPVRATVVSKVSVLGQVMIMRNRSTKEERRHITEVFEKEAGCLMYGISSLQAKADALERRLDVNANQMATLRRRLARLTHINRDALKALTKV